LVGDGRIGAREFTIGSRAYHVRPMYLVEPIRVLFFEAQLLAQAPSVLGHRIHFIPDVLAKI
jgi:hypothetical protein